MESLLAVSLPLAIGAALSPMLFATTTGILAQRDRPRRRAVLFLAGALVPIGALVAISFTALRSVIEHATLHIGAVIGYVDLGIGIALMAVAAWFLIHPPHRRHRHAQTPRPLWWDTVLGLVLQGRDVSSMVLAYGSFQHAAVAHVGPAAKAVAAACIVAIVTLPIWLPIVARVSVPAGLRRRMERPQRWAERHERPVVVTVCVVLGTYLIVRGALGT